MTGTLSHQMRPYGWEGFQEYNLTYLTRARGLSFQGADVMYILNADHLMLIELVRCPTGNLEIGMADLSEEYITCVHRFALILGINRVIGFMRNGQSARS